MASACSRQLVQAEEWRACVALGCTDMRSRLEALRLVVSAGVCLEHELMRADKLKTKGSSVSCVSPGA